MAAAEVTGSPARLCPSGCGGGAHTHAPAQYKAAAVAGQVGARLRTHMPSGRRRFACEATEEHRSGGACERQRGPVALLAFKVTQPMHG